MARKNPPATLLGKANFFLSIPFTNQNNTILILLETQPGNRKTRAKLYKTFIFLVGSTLFSALLLRHSAVWHNALLAEQNVCSLFYNWLFFMLGQYRFTKSTSFTKFKGIMPNSRYVEWDTSFF